MRDDGDSSTVVVVLDWRGMWSVVRAVVAVTLLGLVTPGAIELVEDVAHFVMHGDSLHDGAHDEQHCCSGAFHVCSCHVHAMALPATDVRATPVGTNTAFHPAREAHPRPLSAGGPAEGHLRDMIRPPVG